MSLGSEGTTGATAPTLTAKILVQHQLVNTGDIDRFYPCLLTEHR
jgi:hypothetical protein